jgi:hypothetical protein
VELTEPVKALIQQFAVKYPMPVGEPALQAWTHKLCEQLAYSSLEPWGHKASSPSAPHSKDTIALRQPFVGWDIIIGAGTGNPVLDLSGESIDLSGQYFEPVAKINWLGGDPLPPPITNLEARVADLEQRVADIEHALQDAAAAFLRV